MAGHQVRTMKKFGRFAFASIVAVTVAGGVVIVALVAPVVRLVIERRVGVVLPSISGLAIETD